MGQPFFRARACGSLFGICDDVDDDAFCRRPDGCGVLWKTLPYPSKISSFWNDDDDDDAPDADACFFPLCGWYYPPSWLW